MTTIEYLLNKMPYRLAYNKKIKCRECRQEHWAYTQYRLKIDISRYTTQHKTQLRYKMYYEPYEYGNPRHLDIIGEACGLGYPTLKEALRALLQYKNEIRGNYGR